MLSVPSLSRRRCHSQSFRIKLKCVAKENLIIILRLSISFWEVGEIVLFARPPVGAWNCVITTARPSRRAASWCFMDDSDSISAESFISVFVDGSQKLCSVLVYILSGSSIKVSSYTCFMHTVAEDNIYFYLFQSGSICYREAKLLEIPAVLKPDIPKVSSCEQFLHTFSHFKSKTPSGYFLLNIKCIL